MDMRAKKPGRPAKFTFTDKAGVRHLVKGRQRIACFVPEEVATKLKLIGVIDGKAFSEVITDALQEYVSQHKALRKMA